MSMRRHCDRCGKEIFTPRYITLQKTISDEEFDLCDECLESLQRKPMPLEVMFRGHLVKLEPETWYRFTDGDDNDSFVVDAKGRVYADKANLVLLNEVRIMPL